MLALEVEGASITNPTLFCSSRLAGAASDTTGRLHRWQASSHKYTYTLRHSASVGAGLPAMAATRSCRHNEASASLASQLPQVHPHPAPPRPCGSRLAGDGCYAFLQAQRVACIAGKPAPTSAPTPCTTPPLWEPACRRWLLRVPADTTGRQHLWQASSHKCTHTLRHSAPCGSRLAGDGCYAFLQAQRGVCIAGKPAPTSATTPCATPPLWEPACRRWLLRVPAGTTGRLHRWQASSHKCTHTLRHTAPVGAGLPAMAATRSCRHNRASALLASQLPQVHPHRAPLRPCGSRLAGDGCYAFLQTQWAVCIAGKPVSTSRHLSLPAPAQRCVYIHQ